ncbi:hypothetical protein DMC47_38520 [Nostoc sp. 3335mG]|nr:hypothetical protein DMC47_38520 [Nostoc sp. 3335mG]
MSMLAIAPLADVQFAAIFGLELGGPHVRVAEKIEEAVSFALDKDVTDRSDFVRARGNKPIQGSQHSLGFV